MCWGNPTWSTFLWGVCITAASSLVSAVASSSVHPAPTLQRVLRGWWFQCIVIARYGIRHRCYWVCLDYLLDVTVVVNNALKGRHIHWFRLLRDGRRSRPIPHRQRTEEELYEFHSLREGAIILYRIAEEYHPVCGFEWMGFVVLLVRWLIMIRYLRWCKLGLRLIWISSNHTMTRRMASVL